MKKIILILLAFLSINLSSQTATATLQIQGNAKLDAINTKLANTLTVTPSANFTANITGGTVTAIGTILTSTVEITRPSNTSSYTALDAIASSSTAPTNLIFTNITRAAAGSGYITAALLKTDQSTCTSRFRLYLFTGSLTAINDNDPHTFLYANNSIAVGSINFDACGTEGTGSTSAGSLNTIIRLPFKLSSGQSLYGLLETVDSFTPASGQKIFIQLTIDSN